VSLVDPRLLFGKVFSLIFKLFKASAGITNNLGSPLMLILAGFECRENRIELRKLFIVFDIRGVLTLAIKKPILSL
jgi:hypothetical protein